SVLARGNLSESVRQASPSFKKRLLLPLLRVQGVSRISHAESRTKKPARRMKLLVFAHTPPPHHGQSYMVQLMLEGLGGDHRQRKKSDPPRPGDVHGIQCYHVNTRLSKRLEDIGE